MALSQEDLDLADNLVILANTLREQCVKASNAEPSAAEEALAARMQESAQALALMNRFRQERQLPPILNLVACVRSLIVLTQQSESAANKQANRAVRASAEKLEVLNRLLEPAKAYVRQIEGFIARIKEENQ